MAKATKKQALGRGLSALLKEPSRTPQNTVGSITEISLDCIQVNPYQPRTHFNEEALEELANSIQELGVIQPITVRKLAENSYQLVSGERRLRASKQLLKKTIPAYIRTANDQEMLEMALVENIQRKNLDPIEVAISYQRLIDEISLTQEELSKRVGKKRSTVTNYLRLLKLDPIIQTGMRDGFISMGHGRALINVTETTSQLTIYEKIVREKLSVRQTEVLVKASKETKKTHRTTTELPKHIQESMQAIRSYFGHKVTVSVQQNGKGKLTIPFHSEEDFQRIKKLLQ